jgi:hypothetical protein
VINQDCPSTGRLLWTIHTCFPIYTITEAVGGVEHLTLSPAGPRMSALIERGHQGPTCGLEVGYMRVGEYKGDPGLGKGEATVVERHNTTNILNVELSPQQPPQSQSLAKLQVRGGLAQMVNIA